MILGLIELFILASTSANFITYVFFFEFSYFKYIYGNVRKIFILMNIDSFRCKIVSWLYSILK